MKRRKVEKSKSRNNRDPAVIDLCVAIDEIAPRWAAAHWDNTGLLVGRSSWPVRRVLLCIDLTGDVLDEAHGGRFGAIVSYHPPIFKATKSMIVGRWGQETIAAEALSRRIAVYSPHTALDAVPGGTNEIVANMCGLVGVKPFSPLDKPESLGKCKLVVFVPEAALDGVADALFKAGCGLIGGYQKCSYRSPGQGTFFGTESTSPRVGRRGRLERVDEVRLEVVCYECELPEAIVALKSAHPYETPAFDVYRLRPLPAEGIGQGRIGRFAKPISLDHLARVLKRMTQARSVTVVGDARAAVWRGIVCVGAAGSLPFETPGALGGRGDVVITGEIRHHDALRYERYRVAAIALGHWASERPVLKPLAARLRKELPGVEFVVSRADRDPFRAV